MVAITLKTELSATEKTSLDALIDIFDNYTFTVDKLVNQTGSTLLSDSDYAANNTDYYDALFDFLSQSEGIRQLMYEDSAGLNSIGVGFNMAQWGTDPLDLETYLKPILESIDVTDWENVYNGTEAITTTQAKELFHITMTGRDAAGDVVISNWGDVIAVKLQNRLELSIASTEEIDGQELASLFSLAFNNPSLIGSNLRNAVEDDEVNNAVTEILEHSNKLYDDGDVAIAGTHGIANRRLVEAAVYKGDTDLTLPEAEFWQVVHAAQDRVAAGLSPNSPDSLDPDTQLVVNVQGALPTTSSPPQEVIDSTTATKIVSTADATNFIEIATGDDEILYASAGESYLYGAAGNDTLFGSSGRGNLDGGDGADWLDYSDSSQGVDVDVYAGNTIFMGESEIKDVFAGIEHVVGSDYADNILGNDQNNYLQGLDGADSLDGDAGADTLSGGSGADSLTGGEGDDVLEGGADGDKYYYFSTLAEGHDTINDSGSTDRIYLDGVAIDETTSDITFSALDETTLILAKTTSEGYVTTLMLTNFESGDYDITFSMPDEYYVDPGQPDRIFPDYPDLPSNGVFYGTAASEWVFWWAKSVFAGGGNDYIENITSEYAPTSVYLNGGLAYLPYAADSVYLDGGLGNDVIHLHHQIGQQYTGVIETESGSVIQSIQKYTDYATVMGGSGDDTITGHYGFFDAVLNGGDGNDSITGGYHIDGGNGNDTIIAESMYVAESPDDEVWEQIAGVYEGGEGDDVFLFDSDASGNLGSFDGGAGYDSLSFAENRHSTINLITGTAISNDYYGYEQFSISFSNVEKVIGSTSGITCYVLSTTDVELEGGVSGGGTLSYEYETAAISIDFATLPITNFVYFVLTDYDDEVWGVDESSGIYGGTGNDAIHAGFSNYGNIYGEEGSDTLYGGAGNDNYRGGDGEDVYVVGLEGGTDEIWDDGDSSGDRIEFTDGIVLSDLSLSSDGIFFLTISIAGRSGDLRVLSTSSTADDIETYHFSDDTTLTQQQLLEALGQTMNGDIYANALFGAAGSDTINGGNGNDSLYGLGGDDIIDGGSGNDEIEGNAGADTIDGGDGNDLVSYYGSASAVTLNLSTGTHTGGDAAGDVLSHLERFSLSTFGDQFVGDAAGSIVFGLAGADTLQGGDGNDDLSGDDGADSLMGDDGNDTLQGGAGADTIDGGAGSDWLSYFNSTAAIYLDMVTPANGSGDGAGDVVSNIEHIQGSAYADTIQGDAGNSNFYGGAGADSIHGGAGNDVFYADAGADTLDGGDDADWVYFTDSAAVSVNLLTGTHSGADAAGDVYLNIELFSLSQNADSFVGNSDVVNIYGLGGNDTIVGGNVATLIIGGDGADSIVAGSQNDTIGGDAGADTIDGGSGSDEMDYSASTSGVTVNLLTNVNSGGYAAGDVLTSIERILASSYADFLTGDGNANGIYAGSGADTIVGGVGADNLFGDGGADRFVYQSVSDSSDAVFDTIGDFSQGDGDKIDLTAFGSGITFHSGSYTGTAKEVAFFNPPGSLSYVGYDEDGDQYTDFKIAFDGVITFTSSDFLIT